MSSSPQLLFQLTAYDYARALDAHPTVVIVSGIVGGRYLLVVVVIVNPDDLTVDFNGVGNEDMTFEGPHNSFCN